MRKGCEESDKAQYFAARAAAAEYTASQDQLKDRRYLQNRIDDSEREIRDLDRRTSKAGDYYEDPAKKQEYIDRLAEIRTRAVEKLEYYTSAMEAAGGVPFSRENVKPGDFVKIRGTWEKVIKANPKTVASSSGVFPWPLKHPWAEVQDYKPATVQNL
jgi:uncharacterized Ntn-hydrolase superfamily protein